MEEHMNTLMDCIDEWINKYINGCLDERMDELTDGWMDDGNETIEV